MYYFESNSKQYIAIIGDIIGSRNYKERNQIQQKLIDCLNVINKKYISDIASKFMITLGDEFQGLLCMGSNTINIIEYIERKMFPVKIRFGLGVGEITTKIDLEMPLGADGPAYYKAREMINCLKEKSNKKMASEANIMISIQAPDNTGILVNEIFSLSTAIKNKWTTRQREIIHDLMENDDNQIKAAERLGITQSSVQKSLAGSGYYTYRNARNTVANILSQIGRGQNG